MPLTISEEPMRIGDEIFTARRDATDPNRFQVFAQTGAGPAGYLEVHYCDAACPTDYKGCGPYRGTYIRVLNHRGERLACVSRLYRALYTLSLSADAHNYTADPRLDEDERPHAAAGWCVEQTEYGTGPYTKRCDQPRDPRDLYHCTEHREENFLNHGQVFNTPHWKEMQP